MDIASTRRAGGEWHSAPTNASLGYYGYAEGVGEGHRPQLKVAYVK
ncbi:hypothetical protein [Streptomyces sp. NPDC057686]